VKYHVEDGKLQGRNNIHLDQLVFGDKVESPEATKLPVLFAVNLLKDSKGAINLELPISGSLDDPQFDIGGLIAQVVGNLLKKAATSPFSLLAAAVGGTGDGASGEDLAHVDFAAGGAELGDAGRRKLDSLAKALADRPGVTLEMAARVDKEKDTQALKVATLGRKLEAAKRAAVEAGGKGIEADPAKLTPEERTKLLAQISVGPEDLAALAQQRSEQVKSYLVESGHLPAERVRMASADGAAAAQSSTRVDFSLK
jgi:hypothetical protein